MFQNRLMNAASSERNDETPHTDSNGSLQQLKIEIPDLHEALVNRPTRLYEHCDHETILPPRIFFSNAVRNSVKFNSTEKTNHVKWKSDFEATMLKKSEGSFLGVPQGSIPAGGLSPCSAEKRQSLFMGYENPCVKQIESPVPAPKIRVEICVVFLKIGEIDTLKEQYEADVLMKARWREPSLDRRKLGSQGLPSAIDWNEYWNPKLFIENTVGEPRESAYQMLCYDGDGAAHVVEKRRVKGTFLENLELFDFPFDVQDLTVTIMSDLPSSDIELCEDPYELHKVNRQSFIDEQEWRLYKNIETESKELYSEYEGPRTRRCSLQVKCRAARRPAYFFWNIFLITFLISMLIFATFTVERHLPQNRLQLSFTLVLTSVAFKFIVNQSLPKISYLTYLDKYVLGAMILLSSVCVWHGVAAIIDRSYVAKHGDHEHDWDTISLWMDMVALSVFSGGYIFFNILFVFIIFLKPGGRRKKMKRMEKEYTEKMEQQQLAGQVLEVVPSTVTPVT